MVRYTGRNSELGSLPRLALCSAVVKKNMTSQPIGGSDAHHLI